jgi:hypothetical protein
MVQRVRIAGSILVGNFLKIHFQDLPPSFHTRKRCSSISSHGTFFFVLERCCSTSLQYPSSSLLGSGSLSLRLSSSLIAPALSRDARARLALRRRSRICAALLRGVCTSACGVLASVAQRRQLRLGRLYQCKRRRYIILHSN